MKIETIPIRGIEIPLHRAKAVVVGSGAAALCAAVRLKRFGTDCVLVTEGMGRGTSANAGSDKQTYWRVDPSGECDSAREAAAALFSGGSMHGDIALVEASLSTRAFYHLLELGVSFPHERYGRFPGYRTDHDESKRGSSAGPRTSIMMFERLREEARRLSVPVIDGSPVIEIVTIKEDGRVKAAGLIALEKGKEEEPDFGLRAMLAEYMVLATGGPGALFEESVYPESQDGSIGAALAAGAVAQNLAESQFGLASISPRWNLSGSYQQALPRYYSTAPDGGDEREFLSGYFPSQEAMLSAQFLKGYEWPFDVRKLDGFGSSCIDLLVFNERNVKRRRVYMDFRRNPSYPESSFSIEDIPCRAREYLEKSGALKKTPLERLRAMNGPAIELFKSKGRDLSREPLEIAVCHQHSNGGLRADIWWETSIGNLFAAGELCGTHGIYRPGGSALNSGQVGALRAAQQIAHRCAKGETLDESKARAAVQESLKKKLSQFAGLLSRTEKIDIIEERRALSRRMSRAMGIVRCAYGIEKALEGNARAQSEHDRRGIASRSEIRGFCKNSELLLAERFFLESARELMPRVAPGRGSYLIGDAAAILDAAASRRNGGIPAGDAPIPLADKILEIAVNENGGIEKFWADVRPVPEEDLWFERVWAEFLDGRVYG